MIEVLNFDATNWNFNNASLIDKKLTLQPGGSATFIINPSILSAVPGYLRFVATSSRSIDEYNPLVYGMFSAMYAEPVDTVTEELTPRNGISIMLPINHDARYMSYQEQLKYTQCTFTIYNKFSKEVSLTNLSLLRSEIKYNVYTDEQGYLYSNRTTYTIEMGHTLGDGSFYFNRSYVDEPYYTAPNNPGVTIEPVTNAASKFIGGRVSNTSGQKVFVVCYCAVAADLEATQVPAPYTFRTNSSTTVPTDPPQSGEVLTYKSENLTYMDENLTL